MYEWIQKPGQIEKDSDKNNTKQCMDWEKFSWLGRGQNSIFKAFWRVSQSVRIDQMLGFSEDRKNTVGKVTTLVFNGKSINNNVLTMEIVNTRISIFFIKKKGLVEKLLKHGRRAV